jgi:hypothetical protein
MTDLTTKPCQCGGTLEQVIGHNHRSTDDTYVPFRVCWNCFSCHKVEKAIGRETFVETIHDKGKP